MKIIITESQYKFLTEQEVWEDIFSGIKNAYRGLNGVKRGYGLDYFQIMGRLESLVKRLKQLDVPNEKVMVEMEKLKNNVSRLGIPQNRKDALLGLIENSLVHFRKYSDINDQILTQIKTLNLDSWK